MNMAFVVESDKRNEFKFSRTFLIHFRRFGFVVFLKKCRLFGIAATSEKKTKINFFSIEKTTHKISVFCFNKRVDPTVSKHIFIISSGFRPRFIIDDIKQFKIACLDSVLFFKLFKAQLKSRFPRHSRAP